MLAEIFRNCANRVPLRRAYLVLSLLTLALCLCSAVPAMAAGRVDQLVERLKTGKDFRIRTQAALALGATRSRQAVAPLCAALNDENRTVRAAAAAALGKLRQGGAECVSRRLRVEKQDKVKSVLRKVLARLQQPPPSVIGPKTKYYVAIGPTTNKSPRPDTEVEQLVRRALNQALAKEVSLALAPPGETDEEAEAVLKKHKQLQPIFVWPKLTALDQGGTLKFKLGFTLFTYPGKAFKGSLSQKLSLPGGSSKDAEALEELIDVAAPRIVSKFLSNVERFK